MENLEVFDELYNPLAPAIASIDEVHKKGLWHQTFACWLVNKERKTILLQLRGPKNRIDPNSYDASASGHLSAKEKPEEGFRELYEELGVTIADNNKYYLGIFRNVAIRESGQYINREFCHVYLASSIYNLNNFVTEQGEVDGIFEMNIYDAINFFSGKIDNVQISTINNIKQITVKDMCNYNARINVDKYYLKVMLAARNLIEGCPDLYI